MNKPIRQSRCGVPGRRWWTVGGQRRGSRCTQCPRPGVGPPCTPGSWRPGPFPTGTRPRCRGGRRSWGCTGSCARRRRSPGPAFRPWRTGASVGQCPGCGPRGNLKYTIEGNWFNCEELVGVFSCFCDLMNCWSWGMKSGE